MRPRPATAAVVFAYGSNLCLPDLQRWLHDRDRAAHMPLHAERATLPGWRLVWNYASDVRRAGAANVMPEDAALRAFDSSGPGGVSEQAISPPMPGGLPGALLHIDATLLAAIDVKEGHPVRYQRVPVRCRDSAGRLVDAQTWVVTPRFRRRVFEPPTAAYRDTIVRGAEAFALPDAWLAWLRSLPTTAGRDFVTQPER